MEELNNLINTLVKVIPDETISELRKSAETELWRFHHGLGQWIRNEFLYGPENHRFLKELAVQLKTEEEPDSVSEGLIYLLWKHCQTTGETFAGLLQSANKLCGLSAFGQAIPIYELCLEKQGVSGELLTNLSYAYLQSGQHQRGVEVIGPNIEGIADQSERAATLVNYGRCLLGVNDTSAAKLALEKACLLDPSNLEAHLGNLEACDILGDSEVFREAVTLAQIECGTSSQLHNYIGSIYMDSWHDPSLALAHFGLSIDHDENNTTAHSNMAIALVALQQFDDAVIASNKAIALDPSYERAHWNLCVAHFKAESFSAVADAAATALRMLPQSSFTENFQGIRDDALSRIP